MRIKDAISARLKDICKETGLTVHGLSLKTGISNSTLTDMVKAKNDSVQIKFIFAICDGLDMSLKDFFDCPYFDKNTLTD